MSLDDHELNQAQGALREIDRFKKVPRQWVSQATTFGFLILLNLQHHSYLDWWIPTGSALLFAVGGFFSLREYQGLKRRYPENLQLLQSLAAREGDSVYKLEVPPLDYPPLLEKWNRRLEKRALLWRVDRFLSGKSSKDSTLSS